MASNLEELGVIWGEWREGMGRLSSQPCKCMGKPLAFVTVSAVFNKILPPPSTTSNGRVASQRGDG